MSIPCLLTHPSPLPSSSWFSSSFSPCFRDDDSSNFFLFVFFFLFTSFVFYVPAFFTAFFLLFPAFFPLFPAFFVAFLTSFFTAPFPAFFGLRMRGALLCERLGRRRPCGTGKFILQHTDHDSLRHSLPLPLSPSFSFSFLLSPFDLLQTFVSRVVNRGIKKGRGYDCNFLVHSRHPPSIFAFVLFCFI
ncbi:unnamed protein product [Malus baccata var. baccata]